MTIRAVPPILGNGSVKAVDAGYLGICMCCGVTSGAEANNRAAPLGGNYIVVNTIQNGRTPTTHPMRGSFIILDKEIGFDLLLTWVDQSTIDRVSIPKPTATPKAAPTRDALGRFVAKANLPYYVELNKAIYK